MTKSRTAFRRNLLVILGAWFLALGFWLIPPLLTTELLREEGSGPDAPSAPELGLNEKKNAGSDGLIRIEDGDSTNSIVDADEDESGHSEITVINELAQPMGGVLAISGRDTTEQIFSDENGLIKLPARATRLNEYFLFMPGYEVKRISSNRKMVVLSMSTESQGRLLDLSAGNGLSGVKVFPYFSTRDRVSNLFEVAYEELERLSIGWRTNFTTDQRGFLRFPFSGPDIFLKIIFPDGTWELASIDKRMFILEQESGYWTLPISLDSIECSLEFKSAQTTEPIANAPIELYVRKNIFNGVTDDLGRVKFYSRIGTGDSTRFGGAVFSLALGSTQDWCGRLPNKLNSDGPTSIFVNYRDLALGNPSGALGYEVAVRAVNSGPSRHWAFPRTEVISWTDIHGDRDTRLTNGAQGESTEAVVRHKSSNILVSQITIPSDTNYFNLALPQTGVLNLVVDSLEDANAVEWEITPILLGGLQGRAPISSTFWRRGNNLFVTVPRGIYRIRPNFLGATLSHIEVELDGDELVCRFELPEGLSQHLVAISGSESGPIPYISALVVVGSVGPDSQQGFLSKGVTDSNGDVNLTLSQNGGGQFYLTWQIGYDRARAVDFLLRYPDEILGEDNKLEVPEGRVSFQLEFGESEVAVLVTYLELEGGLENGLPRNRAIIIQDNNSILFPAGTIKFTRYLGTEIEQSKIVKVLAGQEALVEFSDTGGRYIPLTIRTAEGQIVDIKVWSEGERRLSLRRERIHGRADGVWKTSLLGLKKETFKIVLTGKIWRENNGVTVEIKHSIEIDPEQTALDISIVLDNANQIRLSQK